MLGPSASEYLMDNMTSNSEAQSTDATNNYVLVVDSCGDTDIFNLSYDISWKDVSVMLQIKFGYEKLPIFTYTDDEEDFISLDNQEAFDEALKIAKRNSDVVHIQMRKFGIPLIKPRKPLSTEVKKPLNKDHVEMARTVVGNTFEWARNAVKSALARGSRSDGSISEDVCMSSMPQSTEPTTDTVADPLQTSNSAADVSGTSNIITYTSTSNITADTTCSTYSSGHFETSQPLLRMARESSETGVKEPVESHSGEISVPTSLIAGSSDDDGEVVVKVPIASTSQSVRPPDEMLKKIKEEVRMAVSQELSAFRQELNTNIAQNLCNDVMTRSSCGVSTDGPRSPRQIKEEIRQLRKEMKEARNLKKLSKQKDSSNTTPVPREVSASKARKYAASFICENLLDGSCVAVGQQFVKYWVLKNEGTVVWDHQIELKLVKEIPVAEGSPVDPSFEDEEGENVTSPLKDSRSWGPEKLSVPLPIVECNGTAVIAVNHTAPNFSCMYTSTWRLSRKGRLFGPSIWCSVEVKSSEEIRLQQHPQLSGSQSSHISEKNADHSFASGNFIPRKISANEEMPQSHDDDLSNMLSFEMTALADFNREADSESHRSYSYAGSVSYHSESQTTPFQPEINVESEEIHETEAAPVEVDTVEREAFEEIPSDFESLASKAEEDVSASSSKAEKPDEDVEPTETVVEEVDTTNESEKVELEYGSVGPEEVSLLDDRSSVMSDFEVIPLPECFDTTKPLAACEQSESEDEKSSSLLSNSTVREQILVLPLDDDETLPKVQGQSLPVDEQPTDSDIPVSTEEPEAEPSEAPAKLSQSPKLQLVAPRCLPVPQSVLNQDQPITPVPKPLPQTLLDMDKPCPVMDYSAGYTIPTQKTARPEEVWDRQPIPLPRGVLDVNKPWSKGASEKSPFPQARSAVISQPSSSRADLTREAQDSSQSSNPLLNTENEVTLLSVTNGSQPLTSGPSDNPTNDILVPTLFTEETVSATQQEEEPESYTPSPMEQLVDMGFCDIELNNNLLDAFQGDMTRVVNALVYRIPDEDAHQVGNSSENEYV